MVDKHENQDPIPCVSALYLNINDIRNETDKLYVRQRGLNNSPIQSCIILKFSNKLVTKD